MRRVLYTMVLVVVFQFPGMAQWSAPDWATVIKPAFKQVMRLEILREDAESPKVCTLAVINKAAGWGLTAAHCVTKPQAQGISITANGRHAEVVRVNDLLDLAVVKVSVRGEEQFALADETPVPGTPVAIVGYAFGDPDVLFQFGYIAQTKNSATKLVMLNVDVLGGDSGGPCIDAKGRLVAIQSRVYPWYSSGLGASATIEQIREFAEPYLPKVKP